MLFLQILIIIIIAAVLAAVISIVWATLITEGKGTVGGEAWGGIVDFIYNAGVSFIILWILISAGLMWIFL